MRLYVVPTPIGNLQDITLRAIDILRRVDFIIAEDTRYSRKLLTHLSIHKKIVSCYRPKEKTQSAAILTRLKSGDAALISDSGTPLLSDPGQILIRQAIDRGIEVIALPGPTAFAPALAASGIATEPFLFLGFPPRRLGQLRQWLKKLQPLAFTLVIYESPRRIMNLLAEMHAMLGDRRFALAKEISKKNEKWIRGSLAQALAICAEEIMAGEMVLVVEGGSGDNPYPAPVFETKDDIYGYFKETLGISKNQLKKILMKR